VHDPINAEWVDLCASHQYIPDKTDNVHPVITTLFSQSSALCGYRDGSQTIALRNMQRISIPHQRDNVIFTETRKKRFESAGAERVIFIPVERHGFICKSSWLGGYSCSLALLR